MVNPAFTTDDVQMTTGDPGGYKLTIEINRFLKTAEATAFAGLFP